MLNRGALIGWPPASFVSGFKHRWQFIASLLEIQRLNNRAIRDVLFYRASANPQRIKSLVRSRIDLLGRETGMSAEMAAMERNVELGTHEAMDQFYQEHYALSRSQVAKLMDEAMQSESRHYTVKPLRRPGQ